MYRITALKQEIDTQTWPKYSEDVPEFQKMKFLGQRTQEVNQVHVAWHT